MGKLVLFRGGTMAIQAYRWEFVWDQTVGWKQGGKVSAESEQEAKELALAYLRSSKNPNRQEIEHEKNEKILARIRLLEYERSKEVFDCWTENAGG